MKILIDNKEKKYIVKNEEFHTEKGLITKEDIINAKEGDKLKTHMGKEFTVIKPNINDYIELMKRKCSILLPQDIGLVIGFTGLGHKDKVVEAGTGAGASLLSFANIVGPEGHVTSYEKREEFAQIAKDNVKQYGLENTTIKNKDITEGIEEEDIDMIFLDLPNPWDVIESAYSSLKIGGFLAIYTPYIEQFQTVHKVLKKNGFKNIHVREGNIKEIEVKNKGSRPNSRMAGHTGYITISRKL
ncbi:MAG: tRNA (adenine-N1)-methyltransferase [Methanobacteriaceae archaeon]|nr:tRNA (adenine-N1)-methyltransferase [Methanobacteriaceae archaeon]